MPGSVTATIACRAACGIVPRTCGDLLVRIGHRPRGASRRLTMNRTRARLPIAHCQPAVTARGRDPPGRAARAAQLRRTAAPSSPPTGRTAYPATGPSLKISPSSASEGRKPVSASIGANQSSLLRRLTRSAATIDGTASSAAITIIASPRPRLECGFAGETSTRSAMAAGNAATVKATTTSVSRADHMRGMYCRAAVITSPRAAVPYRYGDEFRTCLGDTAGLSPETGEAPLCDLSYNRPNHEGGTEMKQLAIAASVVTALALSSVAIAGGTLGRQVHDNDQEPS